jgi:hypothetical protein
MSIYRTSEPRRSSSRGRSRSATSEIDSFGAWISFLVVFAAVMAVVVVRQNFNDHAYSLATGVQPHGIISTVAQR